MKREELELSRHGTTPAQFLAYVRAMIRKHGLTAIDPADIQLDTFAKGGDIEFDYHDDPAKPCAAERSVSKPYEMQTYIRNWDGTVYNLILEFDFWDEKTGFGYFYFLNTWEDTETETTETTESETAKNEKEEETMKKTFYFGKIDFEKKGVKNNLVTVEMEYKEDGDKKRFSVCGNVWNARRSDIVCGGQCLDTIAEYITDPVFSEILRLWNLYHLNDMHPACEHQAALGWEEIAKKKITLYNGDKGHTEEKALGWLHKNEHPDGILSKACPVCGYKYGTAWKYFPIPAEDEAIIYNLMKGDNNK